MHAMSVDDSYRTVRQLSSGPSGTTELVTIAGSGPFVRKKIPRELARRRVWAALGDCASRHLPRVWATYEMPDHFVVVCDYVAGDTLESYVRARGRLARDEAFAFADDLCEAVGQLHGVGVIHRDISPSNVIVSSQGACLIDFGIARMRNDVAVKDTTPYGTWGFAAPEQYGFAQTDVRSDIYSIGRILGFMVTGIMPEGDGYDAVVHDPAVVDDATRALIERSCAFEPSARFQDASELRRALSGDGDPGVPEGADEPASPSACSAPIAPSGQGREAGSAREPVDPRGSKRGARVRAVLFACVGIAIAASFLAFAWGSLEGTVLKAVGIARTALDEGASSARQASLPEEGSGGMTGGLEGSSSNSSGASSSSSVGLEADCLEIVESAWYPTTGSFVSCVVGIRNVSEGTSVDFPTVTATGYAEDGTMLFSNDILFAGIDPGETLYYSLPSDVGPHSLADVTFTLVEPEDYCLRAYRGDDDVFRFADGSFVKGSYGVSKYCGTVSVSDGQGSPVEGVGAQVTAVFRDRSGRIVADGGTYVSLPSDGSAASYEIVVYGDVDYESVELYGQAL